ncbi:Sodium/hydrogen exchanger family protein [Tepidimonas alkaliphilus]|uniref:Sodium/hydrogen exchanger family protein n=1 Tax=Tepidimonas alkaliphilus TaxID=2588942 RepID=A0A554WBU6_9BURK|nr:cation:proton antiporter [Tepidimonas alkaliphilus]TSE21045.1 Sodium/hydrogen exchanger family protein [Tepidimonas alkaliphilus]
MQLWVTWPALLWLAWWLGERAQPWGVPRVSVYVAVGLLASVVAPAPALVDGAVLALLAQLALALVLFELGHRIRLAWLRANPWVTAAALLQGLGIFAVVAWGAAWLGVMQEERWLLAAVAVAASPAALLRLVNDARAGGQVTERVLHQAALLSVLAVLLVKGVSAYWLASTAGDWQRALLTGVYALVASVGLGVALAVVLGLLVRGPFASPVVPTVGYALALIWLTVVADALQLSPLLAALSLGMALRQRQTLAAAVQRDFGALGWVLGVFLFVYVGSRMTWEALTQPQVWAMAALVLGARLLVPVGVNAALAWPAATTLRKGVLTGVALVPMSALTLLLLERSVAQGVAPAAQVLQQLAAALLWAELLGPWVTLWALRAAREAAVGNPARWGD